MELELSAKKKADKERARASVPFGGKLLSLASVAHGSIAHSVIVKQERLERAEYERAQLTLLSKKVSVGKIMGSSPQFEVVGEGYTISSLPEKKKRTVAKFDSSEVWRPLSIFFKRSLLRGYLWYTFSFYIGSKDKPIRKKFTSLVFLVTSPSLSPNVEEVSFCLLYFSSLSILKMLGLNLCFVGSSYLWGSYKSWQCYFEHLPTTLAVVEEGQDTSKETSFS